MKRKENQTGCLLGEHRSDTIFVGWVHHSVMSEAQFTLLGLLGEDVILERMLALEFSRGGFLKTLGGPGSWLHFRHDAFAKIKSWSAKVRNNLFFSIQLGYFFWKLKKGVDNLNGWNIDKADQAIRGIQSIPITIFADIVIC